MTGFFAATFAGGCFFAVAFTARTLFEDAPRFAFTDLDLTIFLDFAFVLAAFLATGFALDFTLDAAAFALGLAFALAADFVRAFRGTAFRPGLRMPVLARAFDTDLVLRLFLVAISGPCILTGTHSTLIHRNGLDKPRFTGLFLRERGYSHQPQGNCGMPAYRHSPNAVRFPDGMHRPVAPVPRP
ncbi:MAG: hypothetical protein AB7P12_17050 [Alphaproteobacteria bacterium]